MSAQAIDAITSTTQSLYTTKANDSLGKTDFLNLLITQIQQQDPLNPEDPSEFTAQLAQFSNLEQMITMNNSIQDLQALQLSANNTLAVSLIGKDVTFAGDELSIAAGAATSVRFQADTAATNATVTITNDAGKVVRTLQVPSAQAGENVVAWDGKADDGTVLADGTYHVSVSAKDESGNSVTMTALQTGRVSGIIFNNGQTYIDVDGKQVSLGDIVGIHETASSTAAA